MLVKKDCLSMDMFLVEVMNMETERFGDVISIAKSGKINTIFFRY